MTDDLDKLRAVVDATAADAIAARNELDVASQQERLASSAKNTALNAYNKAKEKLGEARKAFDAALVKGEAHL